MGGRGGGGRRALCFRGALGLSSRRGLVSSCALCVYLLLCLLPTPGDLGNHPSN
jgi:hypothetical protein